MDPWESSMFDEGLVTVNVSEWLATCHASLVWLYQAAKLWHRVYKL
jgi:hypothetical protein